MGVQEDGVSNSFLFQVVSVSGSSYTPAQARSSL